MPQSSDHPDLEQRLAFLGLSEEELQRLVGLRPFLEQAAANFVAAFYRHLLSFPATRDLLRDPEVKDRLLEQQRQYLLSLADPALGPDYLAERRRIGVTHERVGLEPRWYLGAYSLYLSLLTPLVHEAFAGDGLSAMQALIALQKRLLLDAQIAMEAYIDRQQHELEYLAAELAEEGRNLARDYERQGVELRATADRAKAAEELASVATLVTGLAHEIGTPMGVIQGHARLLESAVSGEEANWRLRTIQQQIARISRIIQTLLNMAKPRRSRPRPLDLQPLVESSLSFVQEKLARRKIEVVRDLQPVSAIVGDGERIQQLLLNLFLNAADAMPRGGTLGVALRGIGAAEVELRISDTGCGIESADLERIFEPFFTTKPAGEGNGLGLMVVHSIVKDHGGTIEVESAPGRGAEFRIRLPAIAAAD